MKKILYILRHAKAEPLSAKQEDHERRLILRGIEDAEHMGKYLTAEHISPDKVLCSTAMRTRETWENIKAQMANGKKDALTFDDKLYLASANQLLGLIAATPETVHSLMIIGHNPGLHELCLKLAKDGDSGLRSKLTVKFPTCALVTIELSGVWRDIGHTQASLSGFVTPKVLS